MDARTLCLAVLSGGEHSGYEIKKKLDEPPFCHFQDTGFGSIYPALAKLADEGAIDCRVEAQEKRPDKKVYALTEAGRSQLTAALRREPGPDRLRSDFYFMLYMSDLIDRPTVLTLVDGRIAELADKLAHMQDCLNAHAGRAHRFMFDLGYNHYQNEYRFLVANRHRLETEESGVAAGRELHGAGCTYHQLDEAAE